MSKLFSPRYLMRDDQAQGLMRHLTGFWISRSPSSQVHLVSSLFDLLRWRGKSSDNSILFYIASPSRGFSIALSVGIVFHLAEPPFLTLERHNHWSPFSQILRSHCALIICQQRFPLNDTLHAQVFGRDTMWSNNQSRNCQCSWATITYQWGGCTGSSSVYLKNTAKV